MREGEDKEGTRLGEKLCGWIDDHWPSDQDVRSGITMGTSGKLEQEATKVQEKEQWSKYIVLVKKENFDSI